MADAILIFWQRVRKRATQFWRDEDRVVSKAAAAAWVFGEQPFNEIGDHRNRPALLRDGNNAHEACAPFVALDG